MIKHILLSILAIAIGVSVITGCETMQTCPKVGDKAPDFTLPGIDGKNISLSAFSGKPVIINTWSISCIECKREMPYFQEIYNQHSSDGLVLLSVNTADSADAVKEFMSKNGYNFTILFDYKYEIYKKFCCPKNADPNTFFIGKDGNIKSIKIGGFTSKSEIDDIIKSMK